MKQSIGNLLKNARETKGMTMSEVAFHLKTKTSVIEALEKEQFCLLAAPIYVRGFLRKYAELVGLSQNELIDAFNTYFLPEMQKKLNPSLSTQHFVKSKEVPIIQPAISPIVSEEKKISEQQEKEVFSKVSDASVSLPSQQNTHIPLSQKLASLSCKILKKISFNSFRLPSISFSFEKFFKVLSQNTPLIILLLLVALIGTFFFVKSLKLTQTEKSTWLAQPMPPYLDARSLQQ
jgi:transcriptional regulator with XRE-family HTH domain